LRADIRLSRLLLKMIWLACRRSDANESNQQALPASPRNGFAVIAGGAARLRVSKDRPHLASSTRAEEGAHLRMTACVRQDCG
jgi:hypothetical protein